VSRRWATFDCYGTLVDWEGGIGGELGRLFGEGNRARLLARYHELEPELQRDGALAYREVMARALGALAREQGVDLSVGERDSLGRSLPSWPVFPEVPGALSEARRRGWRLAILSNSDRDLIEPSMRAIGVRIDVAIVAGEIGSYKPAHGHWDVFFGTTHAPRHGHVHVAASLFHDIAPANELGLRSVWINRLGEHAGPEPTRELPDLAALPDVLDELVPA
jgi:2-haloacid dehalogenase